MGAPINARQRSGFRSVLRYAKEAALRYTQCLWSRMQLRIFRRLSTRRLAVNCDQRWRGSTTVRSERPEGGLGDTALEVLAAVHERPADPDRAQRIRPRRPRSMSQSVKAHLGRLHDPHSRSEQPSEGAVQHHSKAPSSPSPPASIAMAGSTSDYTHSAPRIRARLPVPVCYSAISPTPRRRTVGHGNPRSGAVRRLKPGRERSGNARSHRWWSEFGWRRGVRPTEP